MDSTFGTGRSYWTRNRWARSSVWAGTTQVREVSLFCVVNQVKYIFVLYLVFIVLYVYFVILTVRVLFGSYDAWGQRVNRLILSPAWHQQKRIAANEALIATGYEKKLGEYRLRLFNSGLIVIASHQRTNSWFLGSVQSVLLTLKLCTNFSVPIWALTVIKVVIWCLAGWVKSRNYICTIHRQGYMGVHLLWPTDVLKLYK